MYIANGDCVICGHEFCREEEQHTSLQWWSEYRIIFPEGTTVLYSGVGFDEGWNAAEFVVPVHPDRRWDEETREFATKRISKDSFYQEKICAYAIHDACWKLLEEYLHPSPIPVVRFYEICSSIPRNTGCHLKWDHGYEGLFQTNHQPHYWCQHFVKKVAHDAYGSNAQKNAQVDPYKVRGIENLIQQKTQSLPYSNYSSSGTDCFRFFPTELLLYCVDYLSVSDVMNLRMASRTFSGTFHSQDFWRRRFRVDGEYGYIFEARRQKIEDWRALYHNLTRSNDFALRNRRRVWYLAGVLSELLRSQTAESPNLLSLNVFEPEQMWTSIGGQIESLPADRDHLLSGCRTQGSHSTAVPIDLAQIDISVVVIGEFTYIAGIRLIYGNGNFITLGYFNTTRMVSFKLHVLNGIVAALGWRGLHAMQIIGDHGNRSRWIGSPHDMLKTETLDGFSSIVALDVAFDGFKITELKTAYSVWPGKLLQATSIAAPRSAQLWYPDVPPRHLNLNGDHFCEDSPCCYDLRSRYNEDSEPPNLAPFSPLVWTHFGGPGGIWLRHIIGIRQFKSIECQTLEFLYDINDVEMNDRFVGRRLNPEEEKNIGYSESKETRPVFPINGENGERIESVEVQMRLAHSQCDYSGVNHLTLAALKLITNWGRAFVQEVLPRITCEEPFQQLKYAPGTTLTGFYCTMGEANDHFTSLGVISEVVEESLLQSSPEQPQSPTSQLSIYTQGVTS